MNNRPIGFFDSGMGGLSVRAEVVRTLPAESTVYFGDGANVPYGPRHKDEIIELVDSAVARLIDEKVVKMVVVACNTATGSAIDHLRAKYDIPIVGMEPAVKLAALTTRTGTVGVLATAAAFDGSLYRATSAQYRDKVRIVESVGEGFVELVECDREDTPEAFETVRRVMLPMLEAGADRIALGCTHYPFLAEQICRVIDDYVALSEPNVDVRIVDSAPAVARRVGQILAERSLCADLEIAPRHDFMTFADEDYRARLERKSAKVPPMRGHCQSASYYGHPAR
ncbi:MAG: glutamate racemase [Alistipes sp.]|jgi:glutamate racemase|nr:glutamate racemase [Alistipes sp.]